MERGVTPQPVPGAGSFLGSDEGGKMVFRKDSKIDAFQRQISALRQQLGPNPEENAAYAVDPDEYAGDPIDVAGAARGGGEIMDTTAPSPENVYGRDEFEQAYSPYAASAPAERRGDEMTPSYPVADAQTSVVAHDTTWKGDLTSEGTIHVHGRVEGTIRAKNEVFIAEEADVDATITAANVVIAGYVKGGIRCGNRFEVLPQGRVDGEIRAPTLVIHDGASIIGQFRMGAGEGTETAKATSVVQRRATRGSA